MPPIHHYRFFHLPVGDRLPVYWQGMGEEIRESPRYRWHGLRRQAPPSIIWQMTLGGRGHIQMEKGESVELNTGMGFAALLPGPHCYFFKKGDPAWHFIWVICAGPAIHSIWSSMNTSPVRILERDPKGQDTGLIRSLLRSGEQGVAGTRNDALHVYRFLMNICRPRTARKRSRPLTELRPKLEQALQKQPRAPIGKDGLAQGLGLSRYQLYRAVKRETGMSAKDWTARRRLDESCRLLLKSQRAIAEVAVEVGLPDANYFARFFRLHTGLSPCAWRRLFAPTPKT